MVKVDESRFNSDINNYDKKQEMRNLGGSKRSVRDEPDPLSESALHDVNHQDTTCMGPLEFTTTEDYLENESDKICNNFHAHKRQIAQDINDGFHEKSR